MNSLPRSVQIKQHELENHPLFKQIRHIEDLQLFMQWHIFAVWDFMSLVKALQHQLTGMQLPWSPPRHALAARLINDIVLGEESDELPDGQFLSHFEMYLLAMQEVGADTQPINAFIQKIRVGENVESCLHQLNLPSSLRQFVSQTLETAQQGNLYEQLGSFFYGRENVIPHMFESLLKNWQIDEYKAPMFVFYLQRHIELDSDSHGPAALKIIEEMTAQDPQALQQIHHSAQQAIQARLDLWDALSEQLKRQQTVKMARAS